MVLQHVRFVDMLEAEQKVVCCQKGQECLYPSATSYFTDWLHPIADCKRGGEGAWDDHSKIATFDREICPPLKTLYPGYEIMRAIYPNYFYTASFGKPQMRLKHALDAVQVVFAPRCRDLFEEANWPHWTNLSLSLKASGISVGVCGARQTSYVVPGDQFSWDHPDGETAGTVDLLQHCRLYVGTDSGVSHLAAMLDTPMLVFRKQSSVRADDLRIAMIRANRSCCELLPEEAWDHPEQILAAIIQMWSSLT